MKASKLFTLSIIAIGVLVILLEAPLASAAPVPPPFDLHACGLTARAVLKTARHEAHGDYWLKVANALNGPLVEMPGALREAWGELQEDLELANDQFQARLDVCEELGHGPYNPDLDPVDFSFTVDNNFFPLVPGRTLAYEKLTPEGLERVEFTTLNETVDIDGFECRVVNDIETLDGEVTEDTLDWFAQQDTGDVWYFGEISRNYEDGFLDNLEGSWRTGREDAKPGYLMLAAPAIDDFYRQEYFIAEAEDVARVISLNETVVVPYGTYHNCLQTLEWSPLEPGNVEYKYYAPGIGLVLEVDPDSGERLELVDIIN